MRPTRRIFDNVCLHDFKPHSTAVGALIKEAGVFSNPSPSPFVDLMAHCPPKAPHLWTVVWQMGSDELLLRYAEPGDMTSLQRVLHRPLPSHRPALPMSPTQQRLCMPSLWLVAFGRHGPHRLPFAGFFRSQSPRLPEDRTDAPACTAYEPQPVTGYRSSGAVFKYVGCLRSVIAGGGV